MTGDFFQNKEGWLHRLDPRISLLASLLLLIQVFLLEGLAEYATALLCLHILYFTASFSLKTAFRLWLTALPLMLIIFILWPLFYRGGETIIWQWHSVKITREALISGAETALRLPLLLLISYIPLLSQKQNRLIKAWVSLGVPYRIGLVLILTLRFLPFFKESYLQIEQAQAMRGLNLKKGGIRKRLPVLISLIVWALRTSENLSFALETRGLGLEKRPGSLVELHLRFYDIAVLILIMGMGILVYLY